MKLRNKKTGEIVELIGCSAKGLRVFLRFKDENDIFKFECNSLTELNEEWEDYEAEYYKFTPALFDNRIVALIVDEKATREEAKKAVEKLKAWKRLKDKGFRFLGYYHRLGETKSKGEIGFEMVDYEGAKQDLDLLFGGEE